MQSFTPLPKRVQSKDGTFLLPVEFSVYAACELENEVSLLISDAARLFGLKGWRSTGSRGDIALSLEKISENAEGYQLRITPTGVQILAGSAVGVFYACQTLIQLIAERVADASSVLLPAMEIIDEPAFAWRGAMLDVSRHFFTADEVCRFIDLLAHHKLNVFHWHLTDDQGWRFPVRKYPLLTEVGSIRQETLIGHYVDSPRRYDGIPYRGCYTREDIQRVVGHASRRHVTIVPEIDMPGHMQAAIAAYPELGNMPFNPGVRCLWNISHHILNVEPATIQFAKDVLSEVMELFPGQFIHVGGDEAVKHEWEISKQVHRRMREYGVNNEVELQAWFIRTIEAFLAENGRRLIGWDEILEGGINCSAAVMNWRDVSHGVQAARHGHDVVSAQGTHVYFDHYQADPAHEPLAIGGLTTLMKVYEFNPIPADLEPEYHKHILGGQAQLWTEYIATQNQLDYMAFPRMCALAETLWQSEKQRNWDLFCRRVDHHQNLLKRWGVNYRCMSVPLNALG